MYTGIFSFIVQELHLYILHIIVVNLCVCVCVSHRQTDLLILCMLTTANSIHFKPAIMYHHNSVDNIFDWRLHSSFKKKLAFITSLDMENNHDGHSYACHRIIVRHKRIMGNDVTKNAFFVIII